MDKAQIKTLSLILISLLVFSFLVYAISTTLISPADNTVDDDGFLVLRGSCAPTAYDGTTSFNITNATLWHNFLGTWRANKTLNLVNGFNGVANATFYFNFTNVANRTAEGIYQWNIECNENNASNTNNISKIFAGNNTITVQYAKPTLTVTGPENNALDLDGNEFNFTGYATPSGGWNITSITLWTNVTGSWTANSTYGIADPSLGRTIYANFSNFTLGGGLSDGARLVWGLAANQTLDAISLVGQTDSLRFSENRTLKVEYPPNMTVRFPDDGNWSKSTQVNFNFTISGIFTTDNRYVCGFFTNESGIWMQQGGSFNVNNGTYSHLPTLPERSNIQYAFKCAEFNDQNVFNFTLNRTIRTDYTNPTASISTANFSYTANQTITIRWTPTDININTTVLQINGAANYTNRSPISGQEIVLSLPNAIDANYNLSIYVNDSSGREFQTGNTTVIVDMTAPANLRIENISLEGDCSRLNITWDTNETTNFTIYYGTTTDVSGNIFPNSTKELNHSYYFNFGYNGETTYYFNISSCDGRNNCNPTAQFNILTPARVCGGWNYYGIYDGVINLSTIQNQSGADLVYVWNQTKQSWIAHTAGLSANGAVQIGKTMGYHTVQLYENTNSTWRRNLSNNGTYKYNVTVGDNFINVPGYYTFGNFTESFMNGSKSYPSIIGNISTKDNPLYGPFNITTFAGYNNSNQRFVNHLFNFTWNNATVIEPSRIEVVWVYSNFNVSWNESIYTNWTRY